MRRLLAVYGLLLFAALAYWPGAHAFHSVWTDPAARGNSHGYLVLAISLALIFVARRELATAPVKSQPAVLVLTLILSLVWLVCWQAGLQDVHLVILPMIAASALSAVLGFPTLRMLAFPLLFFLFAEPMWEALTTPLQDLTIAAQRVLMSWADLPATIDGYVIRFPNGAFEIESGCSGLHFLVVGLAVAALYGELAKDSLRARVVSLAVMTVLALLSNWLRVFTVLIAGYQTDMRHYLVAVDHYRFGWILFALVTALFLFLTSRFSARVDGTSVAREVGSPINIETGAASRSEQWFDARGWVAVMLCIGALPLAAYVKAAMIAAPAANLAIEWPASVSPWVLIDTVAPASGWQPHFQNASASGQRVYRAPDGEPLELFAVMYDRQRQNAEIVSYGNSLLGAEGEWRALDESIIQNASGEWRQMRAADRAGHESLVMWRYKVGDRVFVSPVASQLWYGVMSLRRPPPSELFAMRTLCAPNCDSARRRFDEFIETNCSFPVCGAIVDRRTANTLKTYSSFKRVPEAQQRVMRQAMQ